MSAIYTTTEDNQRTVRVGVYQGERAKAGDNVKIGEFLLEGIPPAASSGSTSSAGA
jgi:molecular chaperone DnaK